MIAELLTYVTSNWPDAVNGMLEMAGGLFILLSIKRLHKDKVVKGVSWMHVAFFSTWGYWNLFYYPHLDQWWSFWGGIGIVTTNTFWLLQMAWYEYVKRRTLNRWRAWREERSGNRRPHHFSHDDTY